VAGQYRQVETITTSLTAPASLCTNAYSLAKQFKKRGLNKFDLPAGWCDVALAGSTLEGTAAE